MSHLNGKGPEDRENMTGRGLGSCKNTFESVDLDKLGKGLRLRRKSGGGIGLGKRLRSGLEKISK